MPNHCKLITDTFEIQNNQKIYDFNKCLEFIEHQGIAHYGSSFQINILDIPIIYKLIIYMIKDNKAALKEQRKAKSKQKFETQIQEQIKVLGAFVKKSKNENDFQRLAEMAGYRVRHFRDAAKGHSKLSDEKWALVKDLIKKFKFGDAV